MPTSHDPFSPHRKVAAEKPVSYSAPAEQKPAPVDEVPVGTSPEILAWVGSDKKRAQLALDAEEANNKPRKGLVDQLKDLLSD